MPIRKGNASPTHNAQIVDEAAAWFVEMNEAEPDAPTRTRFNHWLRTSPEHVRAFLQITAFWEDAKHLPKGDGADREALIARARSQADILSFHSDRDQTPSIGVGVSRIQRRALAAAALLVVLFGALVGAWFQFGRVPAFVTDVGEQRSIRLPDGSTMELNARSKVSVRYTDEERAIDLLEGQALFRVVKDGGRPFVVQTDAVRVRAVGTQFDVYRRTSGTVVTVVEGQVAVSTTASTLQEAPTREAMLAAGEQLTVSPGTGASPKPANVAAATAWTQRQIVFEGAPLTQVVEEFNRYNPRPMVIADPRLETVRISGVFSSTDPSSLLRFLRQLPKFDVRETATEIRISSK